MSFAAGFSAGAAARDAREQRAMQAARQAQDAELHELRMAEARRNAGRATEEDQAFRELQTMAKDGYVSANNGLSEASNQMAYAGNAGYGRGQGAVQGAAGDFQRENARYRQAMPAPDGAPAAPAYDGTATVSKRAAKKSELLTAGMNVAGARRDMGAFFQLQAARDTAQEDEMIGGMKLPGVDTPEFAGMRDQLTAHLNLQSPALSVGAPDKKGFVQVAVVKPDGKAMFTRLSQAEQLKLMQANALMERNPQRAMAMIASVNKDMAEAIARDSDLVMKGAGMANDVAYKNANLDNEDLRLGESSRHNRAMEGHAGAQLRLAQQRDEREKWTPIGPNADGTALSMWSRDGNFKTVTAPQGVDTRTFFPRQTDQWDLKDGVFMNKAGRPVARMGAQGVEPLSPAPAMNSRTQRALAAFGADTPVVGETERGIQWGFQTPDGVTGDPEDALRRWNEHAAAQSAVRQRDMRKQSDYDSAMHERVAREHQENRRSALPANPYGRNHPY